MLAACLQLSCEHKCNLGNSRTGGKRSEDEKSGNSQTLRGESSRWSEIRARKTVV